MDIAGVRDALHSQPFVPFTIRLADGRSLPVPHPDGSDSGGNGRRAG